MDRRDHVTIFKNHGADAGASLQRPHSRLIATPGDSQPRCGTGFTRLCAILTMTDDEREIEEQTRVVQRSEHFVTT